MMLSPFTTKVLLPIQEQGRPFQPTRSALPFFSHLFLFPSFFFANKESADGVSAQVARMNEFISLSQLPHELVTVTVPLLRWGK